MCGGGDGAIIRCSSQWTERPLPEELVESLRWDDGRDGKGWKREPSEDPEDAEPTGDGVG